MKFEAVIGLEVHSQLKTKTKLFSSSNNDFGEDPNCNVSVVDLGLPGALPVLNDKAVDLAILASLSESIIFILIYLKGTRLVNMMSHWLQMELS